MQRLIVQDAKQVTKYQLGKTLDGSEDHEKGCVSYA